VAMAKVKRKIRKGKVRLDLERELPEGNGTRAPMIGESSGRIRVRAQVSALETELQKIKGERDTLLDRLARMQAEFENARRGPVKSSRSYKDYAVAGCDQVCCRWWTAWSARCR
jgi:molecular chaperone GrpE